MKRFKGSITVFILLIFGGTLMISTSLIDILRYQRAVNENNARLKAQTGSFSAAADTASFSRYGFTFANTGDEEEIKNAISQNEPVSYGKDLSVTNNLDHTANAVSYISYSSGDPLFCDYLFTNDMVLSVEQFGLGESYKDIIASSKKIEAFGPEYCHLFPTLVNLTDGYSFGSAGFVREMADLYCSAEAGSFPDFSNRISSIRTVEWDDADWQLMTGDNLSRPNSLTEAVNRCFDKMNYENFRTTRYSFTYGDDITQIVSTTASLIENRGTSYWSSGAPDFAGGPVYCLEYLVTGSSSDKTNLEQIITRLYAYRFTANLVAICGSKELAQQAASADGMTVQEAIISLADKEAKADVIFLLERKSIPLVKRADQFITSPLTQDSEISAICSAVSYSKSKDTVNYLDYLRFFVLHSNSLEMFIARCADVISCRENGYADLCRVKECYIDSHIDMKPYSALGFMLMNRSKTEKYEISY